MRIEEQLLDAMGEVGMDLVDMAEKIRFPKSFLRRAMPVAACAALLVGAGWLAGRHLYAPPVSQPAAQTAEAASAPETVKASPPQADYSDLLSTYVSAYEQEENREKNLELACAAIDGTVLQPGDIFSFNETLGERTAEKGYRKAAAYDDGGEGQLGGGIGQVASQLYCASLRLGLEQLERAANTYVVSYVPLGFDAAVYWGVTDYRFCNSLEIPIRIRAQLSEGNVVVELWGEDRGFEPAELTYEILQTDPAQTVEEPTDTLPEGQRQQKSAGQDGCTVAAYRSFGDGTDREKIGISEYQRRDEILLVGTGAPGK